MVSIIITTYKEPITLEKTIKNILKERIDQKFEILVVAPDKESREVVNKKFVQYPQIKFLPDKGEGKPAALNLAFQKARGEILVLTDGDVIVEKGSINKLLKHFQNKRVGAVSGRPISLSPRKKMLGYWSHWLLNAAHQRRLDLSKKKKYFDCSGYLYAIRSNIIREIPKNTFSDDIYISRKIWQANYKISYEPEAKVGVKYPSTFSDWLKQKRRSAGGAIQFKTKNRELKTRNFLKEGWYGLKLFFSFPKNLKEFFWTILLFLARIYLWIIIFIDLKIRRKEFKEIWIRIESSK